MKRRYLTILVAAAACASWLTGCEATIHQYPGTEEKRMEDFVVQLHADRTPPAFYKEIVYDRDGHRTETEQEAEASPAYLPDDRLALRFVVEVHDNSRSGDEAVLARRELTVDNDALPPQAEVHFSLPAGGSYTAVSWADYVPVANPVDWHYDTSRLDFIEVNTETVMQELHHKNSATGFTTFHRAGDGSVSLACSQAVTRADGADVSQEESDGMLVPVYMTRPSGRLRLYADDLAEFLQAGGNIEEVQVVIRYKQFVSVAYDALGQEPCRWVSTRETRTHPSIVNETGNVCLAYDYILVDSDDETHVMADFYFLDAEGHELSHTANVDIPLRRNRETVVRGSFLTHNLGDGGLGVDEGFDDEYVIVID